MVGHETPRPDFSLIFGKPIRHKREVVNFMLYKNNRSRDANYLKIESKNTSMDAQAMFASFSKYVLPAGFVKLWAGKFP